MSAQLLSGRRAWWLAGFFLLLLNSAYLGAFATASGFYYAQVALHVVGGIVLGATALRFLARHRRVPEGWGVAIGPLLVALATGLILSWTGATRPWRWLLYTHIAASVLGTVPVLLALLVRSFGPGFRGTADVRAARLLRVGVAVTLVALVGSVAYVSRYGAVRRASYRIRNPSIVPTSMREEGAGPASRFFPSSANTDRNTVIPSNFFMTSKDCARCHKQIYDEWNESAHHFASFNNQWYRKSIEYMQDMVGTTPSKWCAGCHDHAVFFNGRFDTPIKQQIDTPEAQNGLSCTSCHAITHVGSSMGNGNFVIEYPPLHDLAVSGQPLLQWTHDKLLELDPQPHRETFLKPFMTDQTPEYCSSCHKVHLDVPVNGYRWIRGFNDYDNWQASGVSGMGARAFYYPAKSAGCGDCHMPKVASTDPTARDGKHKSHRFAAANTALPFVNGHATQLKAVQSFLKDGQVSIDIFGLVRSSAGTAGEERAVAGSEPRAASTFAVGEESINFGASTAVLKPALPVVAPLDKVTPAVRRGESVRLEVVVRTRKVGHFFPGGTVDGFDVWVELEAVDSKGRTIMHSGVVADDGKGPVEPGAHFYRSLLLDARGNPINKRNAWSARSVAYVRLIPPGAADTIHYRLDVPADAGDRITLKARLNYRKFAWWNTQWAFAGVRDPAQRDASIGRDHDSGRWLFTGDTSHVPGGVKAIPAIPITVMAEATATLQVVGATDPLPPDAPLVHQSVRERWNDYGIGLLLQGDLKGAEAAFLNVTQAEPGYADGWVNVARARINEGNVDGAGEVLKKALAINPALAKTHFFVGQTAKSLGNYDDAITHLREAARQFPRDRVVRNQLGRVLFLKRQYPEAVSEFKAALDVDPEDLQAHYNLMLCYQGMGQQELAMRERTLYERFKADEASQAITGDYRRLNPDDNNERQGVHEHRQASAWPAGGRDGSPSRPSPKSHPSPAETARTWTAQRAVPTSQK
ncbi:putative PEP-CTERM system TPR-repeat lipoprotein [Luteitalea pratensis]|uniref:Putative PEP-CTERM system TPR-repeat lipoprotein n=1 Tax=Luteitalea pratensis TaxID=1855912 RepID=A0A143PWT2_LUTPR|nr:tetratricopeptide repeat protein [Luteitalea pratensis]AMY12249.1 putative PEP-CTERM system TPR-repeat lipoprotein [Luteitalea pratensis]